MSATTIHGLYYDDEQLIKGVRELRSKGFDITEVFCPYPLHGLDAAMGLKKTRIAICAFMYGMTGVSLAVFMMWYMTIHDWALDIGGKPSQDFVSNLTAFIPITFECGVLCAAHGMVITYFLRSWLLPGVSAKNPDPRTTDDMFLVQMDVSSDDAETVEGVFKDTGADEVNVL